jgi:uncharacterized protein (TIGR02300 family)
MAIAMQDSKAMRGTKRVCAACEVRFYDLTREPIVCPSCGAQHTPVARPIIELGARAASHTGKTSWRSRSFKRPEPEPEVAEASAAVEDADEETPAFEQDDEGELAPLTFEDVHEAMAAVDEFEG